MALRISSIGISSLHIEKERRQHGGGEGTLVERRQRTVVATQVRLLHRNNTRGRAARMCLWWSLSAVGTPELENDHLHDPLICTCFLGALAT